VNRCATCVVCSAALWLPVTLTLADASAKTRPRLGRPPASCAGATPISRSKPPGFSVLMPGATPLWAFFYGSLDPARSRLRVAVSKSYRRARYGWPVKVIWVLAREEMEPVELTLVNRSTGRRIFLNIGGQRPPYTVGTLTRTPVLDPSHPGHPDTDDRPEIHEWGSTVYFPQAGCYSVEARWPSGSWSIVLGFGRLGK
jgi:hypothetical protein